MAEQIGLEGTFEGEELFDGVAEYTAALGKMNAVTEETASEMSELGDSSSEVAGQMEEAGDSAEDAGDDFGEMSKKGASAREAMRGLGIGLKLVTQGIDLVRDSAKRLGRNELEENISGMTAAGFRLVDSITEIDFALTDINPALGAVADGFKDLTGIDLGQKRDVITWLSDAAQGAQDAANLISALTIQAQLNAGAITQEEAALKAAALAQGDLNDEVALSLPPLISSTTSTQIYTGAVDGHIAALQNSVLAEQAVAAARAESTVQTDILSGSMQELSAQLIYNTLSQNMDEQAALDLGLRLGVLSVETVNALTQLREMAAAADENANGILSADEAVGKFNADVVTLAGNLDLLDGRSIAVSIDVYENRRVSGEINDALDIGPGGQHGANFTVPPGYPNDSYLQPVSSGERVIVIPQEQVAQQTQINLTASYPMQSERSVAQDLRLMSMLFGAD